MTKPRREQTPGLPQPPRDALEQVLNYLWNDEERSFEEDPGEHHLFRALRHVREWLDRNPPPDPS